ncbi:hypothetical protein RSOLAG1IB_00653 [Rhizoctonia solani AG-1 IB]|uniref:PAS domain-containing protein n=1 Tax=Thanatephorus cucumeris (strain AG1-IB / isolate 7/3/14) TaxID=1108050 RepID=A0A0B7F251_THACB|nr:hypothetical protein RSOLAG1IB_00653 [Rhizoctonia solani AG-1 IB]
MDCSFMFIITNSLTFAYTSESVTDVLGFEQHDLLRRRIIELVDDSEQEDVVRALNSISRESKAATLLYLHLLHAQQRRFVFCQMTISVAGNVIVGSICQASPDAIGRTVRDQSAEEVYVAMSESPRYPGIVNYRTVNWTGTQLPKTALLLDRFSADCTITHCTNNAILDNEACVHRRGGLFGYVAAQDEASVRSFITRLKQSGIEANAPTNLGFVYQTFNLCVDGRDLRASPRSAQTSSNGANEVRVSAVGSASSDGLILVIKLEP